MKTIHRKGGFGVYLLLLPLFSFSVICVKPSVRVYVEKGKFTNQFLSSLKGDFMENFKVDFQCVEIDSNRNNAHLVESLSDGSILTDNNIIKEKDSYYIFLTDRPLSFGVDTIEVRGLSFRRKAICIISTHRIKIESAQFGLPFEFQFRKAVKHEFLHLLGLNHCNQTPKCIMVESIPPTKFYYSRDRVCSFCALKIDSCLVTKKLSQF